MVPALLVPGATKAASLPLLVSDVAHVEESWQPFGCQDLTLKMLSEFENNREQVLPLPLHS